VLLPEVLLPEVLLPEMVAWDNKLLVALVLGSQRGPGSACTTNYINGNVSLSAAGLSGP